MDIRAVRHDAAAALTPSEPLIDDTAQRPACAHAVVASARMRSPQLL